jgi:hypothetical protein
MNVLQAAFESAFAKELSFPKVALRLITERFKTADIERNPAQQEAIRARFLAVTEEDLTLAIELTDAQVAQSTLSVEERATGKLSLGLDANAYVSRIEEKIPEIISDTIESVSGSACAEHRTFEPAKGCRPNLAAWFAQRTSRVDRAR